MCSVCNRFGFVLLFKLRVFHWWKKKTITHSTNALEFYCCCFAHNIYTDIFHVFGCILFCVFIEMRKIENELCGRPVILRCMSVVCSTVDLNTYAHLPLANFAKNIYNNLKNNHPMQKVKQQTQRNASS